jgi:hypothetical protein
MSDHHGPPAQPGQTPSPGSRQHRRRRDRVAPAIAVVATVLGLWLGLEGPSVSPIAPTMQTIPAARMTIPDSQPEPLGG